MSCALEVRASCLWHFLSFRALLQQLSVAKKTFCGIFLLSQRHRRKIETMTDFRHIGEDF